MSITRLEAENIKRLKAVEIKPEGSLVKITGKNGQGKSSVLDSIEFALAGARSHDPRPVRDGETEAHVVVEIGDLQVIRKWEDGKSTLKVMGKGGAVYPSPQAMLDKLFGEFTFDPLAFTRLKPQDQVQAISRIVGIDIDEFNATRRGVFDKRTDYNRDIKRMRAQMEACPQVPDDTPDVAIDISQLSEDHGAAISHNESIARLKDLQRTKEADRDTLAARIENIKQELEEAQSNFKSLTEHIVQLDTEIQGKQPVDEKAILDQINQASQTNRNVEAKRRKSILHNELSDLLSESESCSKQIDQLDQDLQRQVKEASLPVPGLGLDILDGVILTTLNGVPFEQAASSEQLRASVGIGVAQKPEIKIMLVREGSLLDPDMLLVLEKEAAEQGAQLWIEIVTDGSPIGIVIEDGLRKQ